MHPASSSAGPLALVVDDDPFVLSVTRQVLEMDGWRVLVADTYSAALLQWSAHAPQINALVTDFNLGLEGTGFHLIARAQHDRPDLPVLVMSGYGPPAPIAGLPLPRHYRFVAKPYDLADFQSVCRRMRPSI